MVLAAVNCVTFKWQHFNAVDDITPCFSDGVFLAKGLQHGSMAINRADIERDAFRFLKLSMS